MSDGLDGVFQVVCVARSRGDGDEATRRLKVLSRVLDRYAAFAFRFDLVHNPRVLVRLPAHLETQPRVTKQLET